MASQTKDLACEDTRQCILILHFDFIDKQFIFFALQIK
jgi:hypothetical protein